MGLAISRFTDICNALCMWETSKTQVRHMFTRQAIGMLWDYAEPNIFADAAGNFSVTLGTMVEVLEREAIGLVGGHVEQASATQQALPDDSAQAVVTDPPYYDAVPYAHLSDFFYVWLRRVLHSVHPELFRETEVPKAEEVVVDRPHALSQSSKGITFYESKLTKSFAESRCILRPDGIGTIIFASKSTASWEAFLKAVIDAGWIITGSWPYAFTGRG
jgi:adenine-specific DNA methylase